MSASESNAQLLNRLKKRTMDKIENRIEDKIVEEVSSELARRAMRPIDQAVDNMIKQSYRDEYGEDLTDEEIEEIMNSAGKNYAAFLEGMNKAADLPPSYNLDFSMIVEHEDYKKKKSQSEFFFSKDKPIIAIKQVSEEQQLVLIDMEKDIIVLYSEKDGKKTAQALPSMMKIAGAMIAAEDANMKEEYAKMKIEGPGKSKTIAGYKAFQYKAEDEEFKYEYYMSSDLPFNWDNTFAESLKQFAPNAYNASTQQFTGMVMEGETYHKKKKKKSKWKTKSISEKMTNIQNSDYTFPGY